MKSSLIALASALVVAVPAHAEDAASPSGDTSFNLGEIVVTARAMAGSSQSVLTSVDRLGGDVAQRSNVNYAWELLGRLPGVLLTNFNQGTTSGKFSFRGFNGEGEVNAVKLVIDGVPSNSNDGNMPYIDAVSPLEIAGIEVVRGTSDPRWGLHAIAGSADITTRSGGTYLDASASAGSFATYDGQLAAGLERGGFSQNYALAYRESDSHRDHGALDRLSLAGKWALALTPDLKLSASARYYKGNAQEPGYLTLADSRVNPRMTNAYNASDGDSRKVQQYGLHLDAGLTSQLGLSLTGYINRLFDDRYVKFSAGASQQRRVTDEDHKGLRGVLHWHGDLGSMPVMIEAGGDWQHQDNVSLRYNTSNRAVVAQTRDQAFSLDVGGAYVQAILEPASWLKVTPGWRLDRVGGGFRNRLNNTSAPINDYGTISQPKLSVAVTPADGVLLYGNWGKSFQIGLGSGAYLIAPRTVNLDPSINTGWEAGVKLAKGQALEARLAMWQQTATGEIKRKLNDPLGDSENVGATRRRGIDLQLSARPIPPLSLWGALTWQKTRIVTPDPATPQFAGNEIDHVPEWLFSAGVDIRPVDRLRLSVWGGGQGEYELTSGNDRGRWGASATVNAELAWQAIDKVELSLSLKNLTGSCSEYVWWDGAQTLHSPAQGRSGTVAVRLQW